MKTTPVCAYCGKLWPKHKGYAKDIPADVTDAVKRHVQECTENPLVQKVKRLEDEKANWICRHKDKAVKLQTAQAEVKRLEGELAAYRDKRAVDGLNGRMWDAGKHLAAEKKIEALKENEK